MIDAETVRDRMRVLVNAKDPESFPYGESGGRIHVLTDMLGVVHKDVQLNVTYCRQCGNESSSESVLRVCIDCPDDSKVRVNACAMETLRNQRRGNCFSEGMQKLLWPFTRRGTGVILHQTRPCRVSAP